MELYCSVWEPLKRNNQEIVQMKQQNEEAEMNLTKKDWLIGGIEFITKTLLAILVYMGTQLTTDLRIVRDQNAELLNRITIVSERYEALSSRVSRNEKAIEKQLDIQYSERHQNNHAKLNP